MFHDENVYHEPETFNPHRFIKDGVLNQDIRDPRDIVFGFGRRFACFFSFYDAR
jgi:cytochrome P450